MNYSKFGPSNSKQTLSVCTSCLYRKANQSKPMSEVMNHCMPNSSSVKYGSILDQVWNQVDRKGNVGDHQCNRTYGPAIERPCAGALLTLYKLRGSKDWTDAMEAKWQAGEYPTVMVTDPEAIGK